MVIHVEMRQSQLLKTNQSQQSMVPYKVTDDQATSSPEEDRSLQSKRRDLHHK